MDYIIEGFKEAIQLIFNFDQEIYEIILLSLFVSITATLIASLISLPIGLILATRDNKIKRFITRIFNSLMGIPPVVLGLFVFITLSRNGPLGALRLNFTPSAMIIAQTLLITPIIMSLIISYSSEVSHEIIITCKTLGANRYETFKKIIVEIKSYLFFAVIAGFSRAISEVGAVMTVGGNIKGYTRVMTTYIALNNNIGNYSRSIAIGLILLSISFCIHLISYHYVLGNRK